MAEDASMIQSGEHPAPPLHGLDRQELDELAELEEVLEHAAGAKTPSVRSERIRIRERVASGKPPAVILLPMTVVLLLGAGTVLGAELSATALSGGTLTRAVEVASATTLLLLIGVLLTLFLRNRYEPVR
jgi:hypothetical protein